jgi:hypothetical protein
MEKIKQLRAHTEDQPAWGTVCSGLTINDDVHVDVRYDAENQTVELVECFTDPPQIRSLCFWNEPQSLRDARKNMAYVFKCDLSDLWPE